MLIPVRFSLPTMKEYNYLRKRGGIIEQGFRIEEGGKGLRLRRTCSILCIPHHSKRHPTEGFQIEKGGDGKGLRLRRKARRFAPST